MPGQELAERGELSLNPADGARRGQVARAGGKDEEGESLDALIEPGSPLHSPADGIAQPVDLTGFVGGELPVAGGGDQHPELSQEVPGAPRRDKVGEVHRGLPVPGGPL